MLTITVTDEEIRAAKSKGHIAFSDGYEFFKLGNDIYRSHITNVIDLNAGVRCGSRWMCNEKHWDKIKGQYLH
jgi:hypothetical protein